VAAKVSVDEADRRGVAVEEVRSADGSDLAVAEEAGGRHGAEGSGHRFGIVAGGTEEMFAAAVAAEEEAGDGSLLACGQGGEEGLEFLVGAGSVAELVLQGLSRARMGADNHGPGGGVGAEDMAHEEIAAAELLFVFVDGEAREEIAPGALFLRVGQGVEGLLEDLVSGAGAEFDEQLLVGAGDGQRFADRAAALADDRLEAHAVEREHEGIGSGADGRTENSHVLLAVRTGGEAAEDGRAGEGGVPLAQPGVRVEAEGVGQGQPRGGTAGDRVGPERSTLRSLDLSLRQRHGTDLRFRQVQEEEGKSLGHFRLASRADESGTGATAQHGGVTVDSDDFLELGEVVRITGGGEGQGQRGGGAQPGAQFLGDSADAAFVIFGEDQAGNSAVHPASMRVVRIAVNRRRLKPPFTRMIRGLRGRIFVCIFGSPRSGCHRPLFKYNPLSMNLIRRSFIAFWCLVFVALPGWAGLGDPNLKLDPIYGLFPRPAGHTYFPSPEDWRDINMYQIFTDRFADGDESNNTTSAMGINRSSWFVNNSGRSFPHNRNFHHGGDWKGLKDNLDYLTGMGVNAVWISGVQMNAQGRDTRYTPYHQYHPTDFFNVDPAQGTFEELKDLIDACHARGVYVILDVVINHTADLNGLFGNNTNDDKQYWPDGNATFGWWDNNRRHPYPFNDLRWFHNHGTIKKWDDFPETLRGQFPGTDDLATDTGHVTYWITEAFKNLIDATDCDGFRVDAIKHVEYNWVKKWADDIRKHAAFRGKNDFLLFGELFVYDNNALASYCKEPGFSFNSALFFPMSQTIKDVFIDGGGSGQLTGQLNNVPGYGEGANRLVTFIDNHDVNRISVQNGGDTGNDIWKLRPALSFLYLATPVPCLYYGTEHAFNQGDHFNGQNAGQLYEGQPHDDADWQRECMFDRGFQPGPAQGNKLAQTDAPLYRHIAALNAARAQHRSLTRGSFTQRWDSAGWGPYAFSRVYNDEESLVALNTADGNVSLTPQVAKPNGTLFVNTLNPGDTLTVSNNRLNVTLSGKETKIYVAGTSLPADIGVNRSSNNFTVTYKPNEGPLKGATSIKFFARAVGSQTIFEVTMTQSNGVFTANYEAPQGAETVEYWFNAQMGEQTVWDSNNSANYSFSAGNNFAMDGRLDSANYEVASYGWMRLWAAVRGDKLYVATWGTGNNSYDHFIFLAGKLGNATNAAAAWNKDGLVFLDDHVYLAGEGDNSFAAWSTTAGSPAAANAKGDNTPNNYLEGVIDLKALNGGTMPEAVYIAAGAYDSWNGGELRMQAPAPWDTNKHLEVTEFLRLPVESIRDEDADGHFDGGHPRMRTVVNGNEQDANYGLRRFFLDERRGEQEWLTVVVEPRTGRDNQIAEIEVFTNLNRRDHAKLPGDEDPDTVTSTSLDTYYLGHPMQSAGSGSWSATLPVRKCGAYRINARWRFAGSNTWHYYTDNGLRRDTAVVVSPKKTLDTIVYELNPLTAEATNNEFSGRSTFRNMFQSEPGRPGAISPDNLQNLGVNMIWLQPIHPIGTIGRQIDPLTSAEYDPGSPYAVRNYWQVNPVLGTANNAENALQEFQQFVAAYNDKGIGIMLDGTFNHSAWDAEIGVMARQLGLQVPGGGAVDPASRISAVRPGWYSRKDNYGLPATYFNSMADNDMAVAPDRIDFGKWSDAADFFFGRYDALVEQPAPPQWDNDSDRWRSGWFQRYLREDDRLEPLAPQTKELWEYFANYPLFWLAQTGLTPGQSLEQQTAGGIAGLRCDFAQGLPNEFWEYTINKTRSVKWDFLFMAESLDGNRIVDGSPRHGVGYRSARHFDILNENMVFVWRNEFFNYRTFPDQTTVNANRSTGLLWEEFDRRKNAFELSPILLNLTSHDEVFPTDDQWSLVYAYAIANAMDGVPMVFYGQEMGAQNSAAEYGGRTDFNEGIGPANNFSLYEDNFGKFIPNFKRYNHMTNVWAPAAWKTSLRGTYARLNQARLNSPALRSQQNYFLADRNLGSWNNDIFAVAKLQEPGVSADQQDVVFAFVNNDFRANGARAATFNVNATNSGGANWFGIQPGRTYNVVDLASTNPATMLWGTNGITGSNLIANGIYVGFQTNTSFSGGQAQYLRLIDMTAGMTATSVNDYTANVPRRPAPQIAPVGNRTVAAGETLSFTVSVTADPADTVALSVASNLAPTHWTFGPGAQFSFAPTAEDEGIHVFRFTATGRDGTTEETITVTVTTGGTPSAYDNWAAGIWGLEGGSLPPDAAPDADPDGDNATNLAEFYLGTDPRDPNSRLTVKILGLSEGQAMLEVSPVVEAGTFYIQESGALTGTWSDPQPMQVEGAAESGEIAHPVNGIQTFFRILYQPPAD
jgi:glycosidase